MLRNHVLILIFPQCCFELDLNFKYLIKASEQYPKLSIETSLT